MSTHPTASVIVPARNCLRYLTAAIASVGEMTDIEIIVVDDGSTDGTGAWLMERRRRDPRLRVLEGPARGPGRARDLAIEHARAPLLAFLDADDIWYPGKLAAQIALHAAFPEAGFSFTDYRHVSPDGVDKGPCFSFWPRFHARHHEATAPFELGADALAQLFAENVVGTSTVVARTECVREVGGFDAALPSAEDWDLWLRLAERWPVLAVPQVFADYLMHRPGNATGNVRARLLAMRMIGHRHGGAARAQDPRAARAFSFRLTCAESEVAGITGQPLRSARLACAAFLMQPSRRQAREAAAACAAALVGR